MNGIVEKTRKKNEVSIGDAADLVGIPRMLIDIRHGKEFKYASSYYMKSI